MLLLSPPYKAGTVTVISYCFCHFPFQLWNMTDFTIIWVFESIIKYNSILLIFIQIHLQILFIST